MSQLPAKENQGAVNSTIHLEFIQNQTALPDEEGLQQVEDYHRALFLNHHAAEMERFQQQERIQQDRLEYLERRLKDIHSKLGAMEKLVPATVDGEPDTRPTSPWNVWDRAMFFASLLGIVGLLVFGVLNVSFNLLESGLVTFIESPVRAYFWAALLPVGALGVKVGWDVLQSRRLRDAYLWSCLILGIAGVLVWVVSYASVYPTLSKSTEEHLESLSVFDDGPPARDSAAALTAAGAKRIDMIIVVSQAFAEIFLSAVLGMYMTTIYARHRPVRLAANPLFTQFDQERRLLEESVSRVRLALAEAKGGAARLENQLAAFIAFAKSIFQKEAALRRDQTHQQRVLLDQISRQLRTQLQAVENGGPPAEANNGETFAVDRPHRP